MSTDSTTPKPAPKKPKRSPQKPQEAQEVISPDQVTYPTGELVVDPNGDKFEVPSDMSVQERQAMSRFERLQTAYALRLAGATQDQIARRLGVSVPTVREYLNDAMRELTTESAQMLRNVYGRRLEMLIQKYWPDALQGDAQSTQMVLSIMDRQFRLYGFDRPDESAISESEAEIVVLSKASNKDDFIASMQRARLQIQKVSGA